MISDTNDSRRRLRKLTVHFLALLAAVVVVAGCSRGPQPVPFAGLWQRSVIYDGWTECPNGDGTYLTAYQLEPFDVARWVAKRKRSGERWVRGPKCDGRYAKAYIWSRTNDLDHGGPPPEWPYDKWLKSDKFYFCLEDYKEFTDPDMKGDLHHSAIWALDSQTYRLYYVAGSM